MSQMSKMALDELKRVSIIYTNIVHDILDGIVSSGESVFGKEFAFNARNHTFEAVIPSEIGDIVLIANRDLNAFAAWSTAIVVGADKPIAKAYYQYDGKVEETFYLIRDPELKAKIRAWFDLCTKGMIDVIDMNRMPKEQESSEPLTVDTAIINENIPHVEADIVSEG